MNALKALERRALLELTRSLKAGELTRASLLGKMLERDRLGHLTTVISNALANLTKDVPSHYETVTDGASPEYVKLAIDWVSQIRDAANQFAAIAEEIVAGAAKPLPAVTEGPRARITKERRTLLADGSFAIDCWEVMEGTAHRGLFDTEEQADARIVELLDQLAPEDRA